MYQKTTRRPGGSEESPHGAPHRCGAPPSGLRAVSKPLCAVDLFCGAGGLTRGLLNTGIPVVGGFDIDPDCRHPFEANNANASFKECDVGQLDPDEVGSLYPRGSCRVLTGCAPCQPFSTYSRQFRRHSQYDKWNLLADFARIAIALKPDVISMENVLQLSTHHSFKAFRTALKKAGYTLSRPYAVYGPDYGLPQSRTRMLFFASLHGKVELVPPSHTPLKYVTLQDSISKLPRIKAGGCAASDPLHASSSLSPINLERIKAATPGGTWRDWPKRLQLKCHKRKSGATYPAVYGRMEWDKPAPTITTQFYGYGNGRFGHPEQNRALSLREGAILQAFPHDYQFVPAGQRACFRSVGRMIGNAVPVTLGEVVGASIQKHLQGVRDAKN